MMQQRTCERIGDKAFVWLSAMDVADEQEWLKAEREKRGWSPAELARRAQPLADRDGYSVKFNQQLIWNFENTAKKLPGWLRYAKEAFATDTPEQAPRPAPPAADDIDGIEMVGIRHADAAFGLGATFDDEPTEIQVLQFPKVWVETITYSPPALLSWVRARGRSMEPTISDGDLILLDHSEREVKDQDDLWAFTVGDTRAIKRLRVKGDRFQIFSDNPSVPPDEEPIDFVNIVARVVFVGKRT